MAARARWTVSPPLRRTDDHNVDRLSRLSTILILFFFSLIFEWKIAQRKEYDCSYTAQMSNRMPHRCNVVTFVYKICES